MPRNSRALLPAKIRTRLEPIARAGRYSHGILYSSAAGPHTASTSGPVPAWIRHGLRSPRASRSGDPSRDRIRKIEFHGSDQASEERSPGLSPGSPGDGSVLSDCSDFK